MHRIPLESTLRAYAQIHAKPHHRQLNRYPIARDMLYIPIPQLRKFVYQHKLSWSEWMQIFQTTTVNECQACLLFDLEKMKINELLTQKEDILTLIEYCDNRWISDNLSSIYAKMLDEDRSILPVLYLRNKSDNPRKRRQSLVSLYYYSRSRKNPLSFEEVIVLIDALLGDTDYYVQKGLGRTVRELYNLYPEQTLLWIDTHAGLIHPRAWQASTEKLPPKQKALIKEKRSKNR